MEYLIDDFSLENNDLNFDKLTVSDELTRFVQEIDVVFASFQHEFIADQTIGRVNLEDLLNNRNISAGQLIQNAQNDIDNNCLGAQVYKYQVKVRYARGNQRDIVIVDVEINGRLESYTRTFFFK